MRPGQARSRGPGYLELASDRAGQWHVRRADLLISVDIAVLWGLNEGWVPLRFDGRALEVTAWDRVVTYVAARDQGASPEGPWTLTAAPPWYALMLRADIAAPVLVSVVRYLTPMEIACGTPVPS